MMKVIEVAPQIVGIEELEPVAAGARVQAGDLVDEVVLVEHGASCGVQDASAAQNRGVEKTTRFTGIPASPRRWMGAFGRAPTTGSGQPFAA
ncbi:MAG: hypothetical protein ACK56F_29255, partial [bacterium]